MKSAWKVYLLSCVLFGGFWVLVCWPATLQEALTQLAFMLAVVTIVWLIAPVLLWTVYSARPRMDDENAEQVAEQAMREKLGFK